jgi:hypothetical protein
MSDKGEKAGKDNKLYSRIALLGFLVILLLFLLVASNLSPPPIIAFASGTAAISIITASAVVIERILEAFWTYISNTKDSWWPLNEFSTHIEEMESDLDKRLKPVYENAREALEKKAIQVGMAKEKLDAAKKEVEDLEKNLDWIKKNLTVGNQRVQMVTTRAQANVEYLQALYPDIKDSANVASEAIAGMASVVAIFKDNPGRRLMSIVLGCLLGLIIAGLMGLDVFMAAGGASAADIAAGVAGQQVDKDLTATAQAIKDLLPHVGVALTGLVIGLGANPTHEVIRALQEYKKSSKLGNTPLPVLIEQPQPIVSGQPPAAPVRDMADDSPRSMTAPAPNVIIMQAPPTVSKTLRLGNK